MENTGLTFLEGTGPGLLDTLYGMIRTRQGHQTCLVIDAGGWGLDLAQMEQAGINLSQVLLFQPDAPWELIQFMGQLTREDWDISVFLLGDEWVKEEDLCLKKALTLLTPDLVKRSWTVALPVPNYCLGHAASFLLRFDPTGLQAVQKFDSSNDP